MAFIIELNKLILKISNIKMFTSSYWWEEGHMFIKPFRIHVFLSGVNSLSSFHVEVVFLFVRIHLQNSSIERGGGNTTMLT